MLLCDVGNFSAKFWDDGRLFSLSIDELNKFNPKEDVYYISVNSKFIPKSSRFIDIKDYFKFDTIYKGLGIDRIAGCYTIENGVIVDAGSAITIDLMISNTHQGGFITPGIGSYINAYKSISPVLDIPFNSQIELDYFPQKTNDAVAYGVVKPLVLAINEMAKNKEIYFTGGDGSFFVKFFEKAIFDKNLVFRGMLKAIDEHNSKTTKDNKW